MGILGSILGFVGEIISDSIKSSTGIDLAKETKELRECIAENKADNERIKELQNNRESYVKEYGEKGYEDMLAEAKENARNSSQYGQMVARGTYDNIKDDIERKSNR